MRLNGNNVVAKGLLGSAAVKVLPAEAAAVIVALPEVAAVIVERVDVEARTATTNDA